MKTSGKTAFTLVEIMIVVSLVGLLSVIAVPSIVRARSEAQVNACINNLRQIDDAAQQWGLENNQPATAIVVFNNIQPYLHSSVICPAAGVGATFADSYTLTTISNKPLCKIFPEKHLLPEDGS